MSCEWNNADSFGIFPSRWTARLAVTAKATKDATLFNPHPRAAGSRECHLGPKLVSSLAFCGQNRHPYPGNAQWPWLLPYPIQRSNNAMLHATSTKSRHTLRNREKLLDMSVLPTQGGCRNFGKKVVPALHRRNKKKGKVTQQEGRTQNQRFYAKKSPVGT